MLMKCTFFAHCWATINMSHLSPVVDLKVPEPEACSQAVTAGMPVNGKRNRKLLEKVNENFLSGQLFGYCSVN